MATELYTVRAGHGLSEGSLVAVADWIGEHVGLKQTATVTVRGNQKHTTRHAAAVSRYTDGWVVTTSAVPCPPWVATLRALLTS